MTLAKVKELIMIITILYKDIKILNNGSNAVESVLTGTVDGHILRCPTLFSPYQLHRAVHLQQLVVEQLIHDQNMHSDVMESD